MYIIYKGKISCKRTYNRQRWKSSVTRHSSPSKAFSIKGFHPISDRWEITIENLIPREYILSESDWQKNPISLKFHLYNYQLQKIYLWQVKDISLRSRSYQAPICMPVWKTSLWTFRSFLIYSSERGEYPLEKVCRPFSQNDYIFYYICWQLILFAYGIYY